MDKRPHLIVGDIHADWGWYLLTKSYADRHNYKVIYVGDYVDSFEYSLSDDICVLKMIREDLTNSENPGVYIRGNHDWGHINYKRHGCRGQTKTQISALRPKLLGLFDQMVDYYMCGRLLVTHAGLSYRLRDIFKQFNKPEDYKNFLDSYLNDEHLHREQHSHLAPESDGLSFNPLFTDNGITWGRIFSYPEQGIHKSFEPTVDLFQVFGHTRVNSIYEVAPNNYCVDTRTGDKSVLLYYPEKESWDYSQEERFKIITLRDLKRR